MNDFNAHSQICQLSSFEKKGMVVLVVIISKYNEHIWNVLYHICVQDKYLF